MGKGWVGVAVVGLLVGLTGCSGGGAEPSTASRPASDTSSTGSGLTDAQVRAAVVETRRSDTAHVSVVRALSNRTVSSDQSVYSVSKQQSVTRRDDLLNQTGNQWIYVVDHGAMYVGTRPAGPVSQCWLQTATGPDQVARLPVAPRFPETVRALWNLSDLHGGSSETTATATMPLVLATGIVVPSLPSRLSPDQFSQPVDVTLTIQGGWLVGIHIQGADVLSALEESGVSLSNKSSSGLSASLAVVTFSGFGEPVQTGLPDGAPVVSSSDPHARAQCSS